MRRSLFLFCLVGTLAVALGVLATLEYRWAGIIRDASRDRMRAQLHTAVTGIQAEFNREMRDLCHSLNPVSSPSSFEEHACPRDFMLWRRQAPHPGIVANVYAFTLALGKQTVLQWNAASSAFEAPTHPDRLAMLSKSFATYSPLTSAEKQATTDPLLWVLPENRPLLVQAARDGHTRRFVVIELSTERLRRDLFPNLVDRYLGSHRSTDFEIGVLGGSHHNALIYQSDSSLSHHFSPDSDEKALLFEGFRPFSAVEAGEKWMLVAKHRQGSLAVAATELSHQWLAINFGVLIVLALGLATIVISMVRAHTFLKLQMEFVAGVSHELRTPLSVIGSAADNLAEGVVRSAKDVQEYGSLIRSECRRLSGLVEQTLRFSAAKADVRARDIQFFRITDVIDRALSAAITAIDDQLTLEKVVDPNLPMVRADPELLAECLLNLISNALKYGGDARWLGIRAHTVETGHGTGVQITVEDQGIGIPSAELRHIFEPFYRGQTARSAQIRGTGLGLSLAREAANSMGARITVKSTVGKGSAFTLHIPPAYMNSSTVPVEALVES